MNTILERTEDVLGIVREEGKEAILQMNRGGHYVQSGRKLEEALRYLLLRRRMEGRVVPLVAGSIHACYNKLT